MEKRKIKTQILQDKQFIPCSINLETFRLILNEEEEEEEEDDDDDDDDDYDS
jgi:hypothetical protein